MKPVKSHGEVSKIIIWTCVLMVIVFGCTVHPDSSAGYHTSHIADGTRAVLVNSSMDEVVSWFETHDYTINEIKGGYRTEPVRLGPSMWALYKFEQVGEQIRIGAYWSKGPSVFSRNYKKNREDESYIPELSTFELAIFRDRGSKSAQVIENLVSIMENKGSGVVLDVLLTPEGDRQYAEIVYSAEAGLTEEEEEAIARLENERQAVEEYTSKRNRDKSYRITNLPITSFIPGRVSSMVDLNPLDPVNRRINSIVMVPVIRSSPEERNDLLSEDFYIQFFASSLDNRSFSELDHLGKVTVRRAQEREIYRYLLGQYETEEEVRAILSELNRLGYADAFVVEDDHPK